MQRPPLDPDVADEAPASMLLTVYDEQHLITYLRLLDAETDGASWKEVARIVLHIDPEREPDRARRAWETHLARARWMTEHGYRRRRTALSLSDDKTAHARHRSSPAPEVTDQVLCSARRGTRSLVVIPGAQSDGR